MPHFTKDTNQLHRGRAIVSTAEPSPSPVPFALGGVMCRSPSCSRRNRALPRLRNLIARQCRLQQHIKVGVRAGRWVVVLEQQLLSLKDESAALLKPLI